MKTIITTFVLLASSSVWATPMYRVQSQIFMNGKLLSKLSIITQAGTIAEISQSTDQDPSEKMRLSVLPSDVSNEKIKDGILMQFQVDLSSGLRTFHVEPQVIARPGSEALITVGSTVDHEEFTMKVIATRE